MTSSGGQVAEAVETPSMWRALRDLLARREKFWLIVTLGMTITNSFFEIAALAVLLPLTNQLLGGDSKSIGFLEDLFPDST
ncbi:MAG: hypothetical protein ACO3O7_08695, partial [Ilumatobacteraceae bacterium]